MLQIFNPQLLFDLKVFKKSFFEFSDDLVEKNQKEITIHDLDALALTLLVDFAYTGEIVISEDNVQVRNNIKHIDK